MANDAQEETSHDTKRRVQQFIKGTIEMQNDDRFKGLTSEAGIFRNQNKVGHFQPDIYLENDYKT